MTDHKKNNYLCLNNRFNSIKSRQWWKEFQIQANMNMEMCGLPIDAKVPKI